MDLDYTIALIKERIDLYEYITKNFSEIEFKRKSNRYYCLCPFHQEETASFTINSDNRTYRCYGCNANGSIIDFVMTYYNTNILKAVKIICSTSEIKFNDSNISEIYKHMKSYSDKIKKKEKRKDIEFTYVSDNVISSYHKAPIKEWLKEGISQSVLDTYEVRYDQRTNRIVFPVRDETGKIRSIKGRTLFENYKELSIPKYINYQKLFEGNILWGEWISKKIESIKQKNEVIIFEAEKSTMKLDSFDILNSLASSTSSLTDSQIRKILKLNADVVIAFDKDKTYKWLCSTNYIQTLRRFTNVYLMIDKSNSLGEKDSPIDRGIDVFKTIYNEKLRL